MINLIKKLLRINRYFLVSYQFQKGGDSGFGYFITEATGPITRDKMLESLEQGSTLVIINYQEISKDIYHAMLAKKKTTADEDIKKI